MAAVFLAGGVPSFNMKRKRRFRPLFHNRKRNITHKFFGGKRFSESDFRKDNGGDLYYTANQTNAFAMANLTISVIHRAADITFAIYLRRHFPNLLSLQARRRITTFRKANVGGL